MMLAYSRIVIPFIFLFSKNKNSEVFAHSHFKMALNFLIIGITAATALILRIMLERKKTGILSLIVIKEDLI